MLVIRSEQMHELVKAQRAAFVARALEIVRAGFPAETAELTADNLYQIMEDGIHEAEAYRILHESDVLRFLVFWFPVRSRLKFDLSLAWATEILEDDRLSETEKLDAIDHYEVFVLHGPAAGGGS